MILLVDVGNSAIKWAALEQNNLSIQQYTSYKVNKLETILTQVWQSLNKPKMVWVSNVAGPHVGDIITNWTIQYWQCRPNFAKTTNCECGVTNGYKYPEQLGVDRWLALIGAYSLAAGMLCVVDCGTAFTLDVLTADGQHLGGIIAPGLSTMRTTLSQNTYKLENCEQFLANSEFSLANETNNGIIFGTSYAMLGLLEYVMIKLENRPKLIITGGDAFALKPFLSRTYRHIPDLVLQGLKAIINHYEKPSSVTNFS